MAGVLLKSYGGSITLNLLPEEYGLPTDVKSVNCVAVPCVWLTGLYSQPGPFS